MSVHSNSAASSRSRERLESARLRRWRWSWKVGSPPGMGWWAATQAGGKC